MEAQRYVGRRLSVKNKLRSALVNRLMSPRLQRLRRRKAELQRRASGQPHTVDAFLQIDDPYSYLLATTLPALARDYDVSINWHLSEALGDGYLPEPGMLAEYAVQDCARLAAELGIPFLDRGASPPTERRVGLTDAIAAGSLGLREALEIYWRGDSEAANRVADNGEHAGKGRQTVSESQALLQQLGHYSSAMLHYGGEWYWGVDRLHYLMQRFDGLELQRDENTVAPLAALRQLHCEL